MCRCGQNHNENQPPWSAYFSAIATLVFVVATVGCFYGLSTESENVTWYSLGAAIAICLTLWSGTICVGIIRRYNQEGRPK